RASRPRFRSTCASSTIRISSPERSARRSWNVSSRARAPDASPKRCDTTLTAEAAENDREVKFNHSACSAAGGAYASFQKCNHEGTKARRKKSKDSSSCLRVFVAYPGSTNDRDPALASISTDNNLPKPERGFRAEATGSRHGIERL